MKSHKKRDFKFFIFSAIGVFNTLFDVALYVLFYNLTRSIVIANLIATSIALIGSYLLNSRLTFKAKKWSLKSFLLFVAVTVFGLWFLQTGIIYALTPLVHHLPQTFWNSFGAYNTAKTVIPKLLATGVTFVWNFVWYNKVIFKDQPKPDQLIASLD